MVEIYGGKFNKPVSMLYQLATNGVVAVSGGDVIGVDDPAQIAAAKATAEEITKASIFLDGANGKKYNYINNDMENDLYKGTDNYPTIAERTVHLLNTSKIKFEYTKKGVNIMYDEE